MRSPTQPSTVCLKPTASWAALKTAWPARQGRGFSHSALMGPHEKLEWFVQICGPQHEWCGSAGMRLEECNEDDQKAGALLMWRQAERLGAVQPGGHLIAAFQHLRGVYKKAGEALLTKACSDRKWDNGFILKEVIFWLDVRERFFTVRMVRHWNRLLREAVDVPSPGKARLNGALSDLV